MPEAISYYNQMTYNYIEHIGKIISDPGANKSFVETELLWEPHITLVIDFLLEIKSFEFLFMKMKQLFFDFKMNGIFLHCIEYFIQ